MNNKCKFLVLLLMLGLAAQVRASIMAFDNMPTDEYQSQVGGASYGPDFFSKGSPATLQGMQFTSSASGYLTGVYAPMTTYIGPQLANVELSLWSDGGNVPLTMIESAYLLVNTVTTAPILEWTWQGTTLLEQGMNYWIVAQTNTPQTILSWQYVPGYLSTSAVRTNKTVGVDWQIFFGDGGETAMRIMVTPVPEPSSLGLVVLGLSGYWAMSTRRRKKESAHTPHFGASISGLDQFNALLRLRR